VASRWLPTLAVALAFVSGGPAHAAGVDDFYRGKTVTLQIGYAAGGGYDVYARQLARHYGHFLPGQPAVVTQNVPGAGSLKLANQIYNAAPRDGTVIGAIGREQVTAQLFGVAGVQFDATKVNWVGNMDRAASLCVAWHTAPFQRIEDVLQQEMAVGGTGPASTTVVLPTALNQLLGYKFKIISGYPGGGDITLALERGEVQGRCSWSYASILSTRPDWLRDGKIRPLAASASARLPELPDVRTVIELAEREQDKQVLRLILAGDEIARPFMAPPEVPPDRLKALRDAFSATVRDPQFLAEARQQKLELDPMDWAEMTDTIRTVYATPQPVVAATMKMLQSTGR
jgi:tripartite-type tricarboxylate transporter receptor subunit TctC